MKLTRLMVPSNKYNIKCPYTMQPNGICVHNTANKASAMAEISYMVGNNNQVSYHYAVDDYRIVQGVEENRNAWHAGDGLNGNGNRNKIAIEICHSTNSDTSMFDKSEKLAAKFIAYLLKKKGWGIEKVSKHQDYSGKYCPHKTLDLGWTRFLNLIRAELGQAIQSNDASSNSKVDYTGVITYQAYTNEWLPEVFKADNTNDGFAGIGNKAISGFRCRPEFGDIVYEAHQLGGNWLGAVNSKDYKRNDKNKANSYAGIYGKPIDGIRIKSSKGYVDYRVKTKEDGWLFWARGFGSEGNEFAGIYGHTIIGIQMK